MASYLPSKSLLTLRHLKDARLRLLGRPHEADFEPLRKLAIAMPVVVDVGANRGQSIESFRCVLAKPVIHAFEPNPVLSDGLKRRYPGVRVYAVGLGRATGELCLFVPRYGYTFWDTRASLDFSMARSFLKGEHFACFNERRAAVEELRVPIIRLDDLALTPNILKIDAEGMEASVLEGAFVTLESEPVVITEGCSDAVMQILSPLGYAPYRAEGTKIVAGSGGLNTYFLKHHHHELFLDEA
ncbi:MAG: FkbM family methyltransferase [Gammaproteobacteria bacterium]|nr:FkbM family methyltransferase [Gammaproteobacteria bacterium]